MGLVHTTGEIRVGDKDKPKKIDGKRRKPWGRKQPKIDEAVEKEILRVQEVLKESIDPVRLSDFNGFQRKQIYRHFEKTQEYEVKSYKNDEDVTLKVYPIGNLKRLAEQKIQEVLMHGKPETLPPMGSYERFVIHNYLKEREGVTTESVGERGKDRRIEIRPVFGRTLRRAKKRLM